MKDPVLIINGLKIIDALYFEYTREHSQWDSQCKAIHNSFKQKTSRMEKNGKYYEYTKWYKEKPGGGLECIGSQEPDFKKYYPPEPKPRFSFEYKKYDGHVVLEMMDYQANRVLFKECLVFKFRDCLNLFQVLFANPEKALKEYEIDSVWKSEPISERSLEGAGQKEDLCWNDGDCESCDNDECPEAEQDSLSVPQGPKASARDLDRTNQFCMGCGDSFAGSILDHRCKEKVSPEVALAKIGGGE